MRNDHARRLTALEAAAKPQADGPGIDWRSVSDSTLNELEAAYGADGKLDTSRLSKSALLELMEARRAAE